MALRGHRWEDCRNGDLPYGAVHAGINKTGHPMFVGRALHDGDILPAKIVPSCHCAYVSWGGKEYEKKEYEAMVVGQTWVWDREGRVPPNAIPVGMTRDGEELFMGRVRHEGTLTPGKVHPSQRCCYIPWYGQELKFEEYEVLVHHYQ